MVLCDIVSGPIPISLHHCFSASLHLRDSASLHLRDGICCSGIVAWESDTGYTV
jgi:hypothetical protein